MNRNNLVHSGIKTFFGWKLHTSFFWKIEKRKIWLLELVGFFCLIFNRILAHDVLTDEKITYKL